MTLNELNTALDAKAAIIVHFSAHADMGREGMYFPHDLQNAIANTDRWPLSCSVLWPDHGMSPTGSIGVIFELVDVSNVISVRNDDSASNFTDDGSENSLGNPLDWNSFHESFEVRSDYNEWRVRGARPVGIYVEDESSLEARIPVDIALLYPDMPDYLRAGLVPKPELCFITLNEVKQAFPSLPVRTFANGALTTL